MVQHGPAVVVKQPVGVFDLVGSLPTDFGSQGVVQRFRANERGLYFYITPSHRMAGGVIIETDFRGNVLNSARLPSDLEVSDFDADVAGGLAVLALDNGPTLLKYGRNGNFIGSSPAPTPNVACVCRLGEATLGASFANRDSALVGLDAWPHDSVPVRLKDTRRPPILVCDPAGKALLVERITALIHVVSPAGEIVLSPRTPEMSWAQLTTTTPSHNVVFSSVALCPGGGVYITLGHFTLAEGAPVLHIDENGDVVERIRLALPRFMESIESENPLGFMTAGEIGAAGSWLFLTSGDGRGKVVFYHR